METVGTDRRLQEHGTRIAYVGDVETDELNSVVKIGGRGVTHSGRRKGRTDGIERQRQGDNA